MTPAAARAMYRRQLAAHGETITLRRVRPNPPGNAEAQVRARAVGFAPGEIASGVDQGERKILLLAADVEAAVAAGTWPAPVNGADVILKNDRIMLRGRALVVQSIDDSTRRVGGVLVAYEIRAEGA